MTHIAAHGHSEIAGMAGSDSANLRSDLLNEALGFGGCGLYQSNPTGQEIIFSATCQKRSDKAKLPQNPRSPHLGRDRPWYDHVGKKTRFILVLIGYCDP